MTEFEPGDRVKLSDLFFDANPGLSKVWRGKIGTIKKQTNSKRPGERYNVLWDGSARSSIATVESHFLTKITTHVVPIGSKSFRGISEEQAYANGYAAGTKDAIREAAQVADGFRCGSCGMDGKAAEAIRALLKKESP